MRKNAIEHVTDTAYWVATYRALETERADALFRDPLAAVMVEGRGFDIAGQMAHPDRIQWSVVIRTKIIDDFILAAVAGGVDTVLNLGAGLDTRPYRMNLPKNLKWIEIDFPETIQFKDEKLKNENPVCQLERIQLDLSDRKARRKLLDEINAKAKKVFVLTEGVVPYLKIDEVESLAADLKAQTHFAYWVTEYFSKFFLKFAHTRSLKKQLKKAPLEFQPEHWHSFFEGVGWKVKDMSYSSREGRRLMRPPPSPYWFKMLKPFLSIKKLEKIDTMFGYALLEKS